MVDAELIALLREALDALRPRRASCGRCLLARLAEILHFAGDPDGVAAALGEARRARPRAGRRRVLAAALAGRHVALLHVEHVDERLAIRARAAGAGRRAPATREREMQALQGGIFDRLCDGDVRGARQDLERLDALARELRAAAVQPLRRRLALRVRPARRAARGGRAAGAGVVRAAPRAPDARRRERARTPSCS